MDCNLDAGNIIERLADLEKIHAELIESTNREIRDLKRALAKMRKERDEMFSKLKQMSDKVVPPLVEQVVTY